jgi:hypothetical protein
MLSIIASFLILFPSFLQDPSGNWIKSTESAAGNEYYYKSKYLSKVGSKITIWVKKVYKFPEEKYGLKRSYDFNLQECDCQNFSTKDLSIIQYTERGEEITANNYKDPEISYAPPQTVRFQYISDICTRFNKKKK